MKPHCVTCDQLPVGDYLNGVMRCPTCRLGWVPAPDTPAAQAVRAKYTADYHHTLPDLPAQRVDPDRALFSELAYSHQLALKPTTAAVRNITAAHRHRERQAHALVAAMLCQWANPTTGPTTTPTPTTAGPA